MEDRSWSIFDMWGVGSLPTSEHLCQIDRQHDYSRYTGQVQKPTPLSILAIFTFQPISSIFYLTNKNKWSILPRPEHTV